VGSPAAPSYYGSEDAGVLDGRTLATKTVEYVGAPMEFDGAAQAFDTGGANFNGHESDGRSGAGAIVRPASAMGASSDRRVDAPKRSGRWNVRPQSSTALRGAEKSGNQLISISTFEHGALEEGGSSSKFDVFLINGKSRRVVSSGVGLAPPVFSFQLSFPLPGGLAVLLRRPLPVLEEALRNVELGRGSVHESATNAGAASVSRGGASSIVWAGVGIVSLAELSEFIARVYAVSVLSAQ
jgi:hypothetical protein